MGIDKERLTWTVIFSMEMFVVLIGNAVAIAAFWKQRSTLKRTCYLLINLSVADFLVGIGEIPNLVNNILYLINSKPVIWDKFLVLDVFAGLASLLFLTLISMERLYAIAWPFQHRATTARVYIFFIVGTWSLPVGIAITLLCGFVFEAISVKIAYLFVASFFALCVAVISCSYLAIWKSKRNNDPRIPIERQEQNKKLATTLLVVSFLSLLTWLPLTMSIIIKIVVSRAAGLKKWLHYSARFLQLANSAINPIVYYARMPEFRKQLKSMILRQISPEEPRARQLQNILMGDNSLPVLVSFCPLSTTSVYEEATSLS